jgi:malonyl-CoA O-methyltransferase
MSLVSRRFSRAAQTYEQGAALHRHVAARLAGMMPDPETVGPGRILEVGCGTGVLSEKIRQRFPDASLCLLDAAPAMIDCVRERWGDSPGVETVVADVMEYRAVRPFDWIFSSSALHWMVPLTDAFTSLKANLAPGGGICAALMLSGTLGELHTLRRQVAPGKVPSASLPDTNEVCAALSASGFEVSTLEEEVIRTRYHSADDFLQTLHAQGLTGGAVSRSAVPLSRAELTQLRREYEVAFRDDSGGVYATFVVQYFTAVIVQA